MDELVVSGELCLRNLLPKKDGLPGSFLSQGMFSGGVHWSLFGSIYGVYGGGFKKTIPKPSRFLLSPFTFDAGGHDGSLEQADGRTGGRWF